MSLGATKGKNPAPWAFPRAPCPRGVRAFDYMVVIPESPGSACQEICMLLASRGAMCKLSACSFVTDITVFGRCTSRLLA